MLVTPSFQYVTSYFLPSNFLRGHLDMDPNEGMALQMEGMPARILSLLLAL
nr:hypothetical protein Q903MT_gene2048 [Picea sitchensis]